MLYSKHGPRLFPGLVSDERRHCVTYSAIAAGLPAHGSELPLDFRVIRLSAGGRSVPPRCLFSSPARMHFPVDAQSPTGGEYKTGPRNETRFSDRLRAIEMQGVSACGPSHKMLKCSSPERLGAPPGDEEPTSRVPALKKKKKKVPLVGLQ